MFVKPEGGSLLTPTLTQTLLCVLVNCNLQWLVLMKLTMLGLTGTSASLARLALSYVDILLCHRPDPVHTLFV